MKTSGFFDIETEGWERFVVGGLLYEGHYREAWWQDEDTFVEWLLDCRGIIWTWNGGRYDLLWLAKWLKRLELRAEPTAAGSRITRLRVGAVTFRDIRAILAAGFSQRAALDLLSADVRKRVGEVKETGLRCRCGDDCGGYCSIRREGMTKAERRKLSEYLERDIRQEAAIMEAVEGEFERCGYTLKGTIGGSAWATARSMGVQESDWPDSATYEMARMGYFGGRTEVYRTKAESGHRYDLNSAYPAALVNVAVPVGGMESVGGKAARRAFARGREGIYQARVKVPVMHIPPLPWRFRERVCYPTGELHGSWTGLELRYAAEVGCDVTVDSAIVWADSAFPMRSYMERIWKERARYESDSAWRKLHKLMGNSPTGKFAERPERERIVIHPDPDSIEACAGGECGAESVEECPRPPTCCDHHCTGQCGVPFALDPEGVIWAFPFYRIGTSAHVQWAAYLTAATRIEDHRQLTSDGRGGETAVYTDTDACYATTRRKRRVGKKLGEWGYEGPFRDWEALAPKTYRYRIPGGAWVQRAKGIPMKGNSKVDMERWDTFKRGGDVIIDWGVKTFRAAARDGNLFQRQRMKRSRKASPLVGSRLRVGNLTEAVDSRRLVSILDGQEE